MEKKHDGVVKMHIFLSISKLQGTLNLQMLKSDRIDSLHVRDDSEIDWKLISDENWNLFSPHVIQRRWLTMKRGIKGYEDMSHQGL
jgi:hypothetical protein